jgi:hypothetical protein
MSNFEILPNGSVQELRLARDLVEKIILNIESHGRGIFPYDVLTCFDTLCKFYEFQLADESENYE